MPNLHGFGEGEIELRQVKETPDYFFDFLFKDVSIWLYAVRRLYRGNKTSRHRPGNLVAMKYGGDDEV
jgi:hypothetical protein